MTDRELLKRYIHEKSQDAFATLVERYAGLVHGTCMRVLNEAHAAEDASQATFLVFAQKAETFSDDVVIAGWLHRAAVLAARDLQKAALRRQTREKEAGAMPRDEGTFEANWASLQPEVDAALNALPLEQRDTVVLRYLHGLSHAQLAAEFSCSPETVHTRLNRGLRTLREILQRRRVYVSLALLAVLLEKNAHASASGAVVLSIQQKCAAQALKTAATATAASTLLRFISANKMLATAAGSAALIALGIALFPTEARKPVAVIPAAHPIPAILEQPQKAMLRPAPATTEPNGAAPIAKNANNTSELALQSSLEWLAKIQEPDGRFDGGKYGALENQDVAVTSLALLTYLGCGYTTMQGDYKPVVQRTVDWLKANPSLEITQSALRVVALAEHAGMTNKDRDFVQNEVNALIARQEPAGLWLEPEAKQLYEKVIEPSTWSAFALKSAQVSGLNVPPAVMDRARNFLRLQSEAGALTTGPQDILSRASLFNARKFLGDKTGIEELTAELMDHKPAFNPEGLGTEIIAWYQGSLAAFNNAAQWNQWSPVMRRELVSNQVRTGEFAGSWNVRQSSENFKWGRIGASSMSAMSLEIYYRYSQLMPQKETVDVPVTTDATTTTAKIESGADF